MAVAAGERYTERGPAAPPFKPQGRPCKPLPGGANVNIAPGTGQAIIDNAPRQENRIERRARSGRPIGRPIGEW